MSMKEFIESAKDLRILHENTIKKMRLLIKMRRLDILYDLVKEIIDNKYEDIKAYNILNSNSVSGILHIEKYLGKLKLSYTCSEQMKVLTPHFLYYDGKLIHSSDDLFIEMLHDDKSIDKIIQKLEEVITNNEFHIFSDKVLIGLIKALDDDAVKDLLERLRRLDKERYIRLVKLYIRGDSK